MGHHDFHRLLDDARVPEHGFELGEVPRDAVGDVDGEDLRVGLDEVDDVGVREEDGELAHLGGKGARHVHGEHLRVSFDDASEVDAGE